MIHFLEENEIKPKDETYQEVYDESIKCHHNDIANYIQDNYFQSEKDYSNDKLINGLKYYNFMLIKYDIENETSFGYLCKYDYYLLVFILCKNTNIDINKKIIYIVIF